MSEDALVCLEDRTVIIGMGEVLPICGAWDEDGQPCDLGVATGIQAGPTQQGDYVLIDMTAPVVPN